jgi:hypothetical protein
LRFKKLLLLSRSFFAGPPSPEHGVSPAGKLDTKGFVPMAARLVSKKSPLAAKFSENDAVEFLGDVMDCAFRNTSDPRGRQMSLVKEFAKRWQFSDDIHSLGIQETALNLVSH